jgi:hypothetical protein
VFPKCQKRGKGEATWESQQVRLLCGHLLWCRPH